MSVDSFSIRVTFILSIRLFSLIYHLNDRPCENAHTSSTYALSGRQQSVTIKFNCNLFLFCYLRLSNSFSFVTLLSRVQNVCYCEVPETKNWKNLNSSTEQIATITTIIWKFSIYPLLNYLLSTILVMCVNRLSTISKYSCVFTKVIVWASFTHL